VIVKLWAEKRPAYMGCLRSASLGRNYGARGASAGEEVFKYMGASAGQMQLGNWSPASDPVFADTAEKAATVEGAKSEQRFGQTIWQGEDAIPEAFVFILQGKNETASNSNAASEALFCSSCGAARASSSARFCHQCGDKLPC